MVQTVGDEDAQAYCKDEFQAWSEHFARPLIQKAIGERYAAEAGVENSAFRATVDRWRQKLDGAFARCVPHDSQAEKGDTYWKTCKNVPLSAYKPTTGAGEWPFLATIDRATVQNFWVVHERKHLHHPGLPLLQLIRMPPRGHDLHQLVEHAIGAMKGHVGRGLRAARREKGGVRNLTTQKVQELVREGCKLYDKDAWDANLPRLLQCIEVIATEKGKPTSVYVERKDAQGKKVKVMVRGTGGGYAPPALS